VLVPLAFLAFVLRAQIVRLALGYGKFGWEDTVNTIDTFSLLVVGLVGHGVLLILLRAYFALEDAKTPLVVLLFGTALTIVVALSLRSLYGTPGLAFALSLGTLVNTVVLFVILARRLRFFSRLRYLFRSVAVFCGASLVAAVAARGMLYLAADYFVTTREVWGLLVQGILATIVGAVVYIAVAWLFKVPEVEILRIRLSRLLPSRGVVFQEHPEEELPR
jgi:putative peptidoglycan lipid II flippase